jgi:hypothetical protein
MLIKNPWNDPMVKKVGLYEMYIIDALCEALEITVEEDPKSSLGRLNPQYKKLHALLSEYLEEISEGGFDKILYFAQTHLGRRVKLVTWQVPDKDLTCWPDIRVLDTPDECLSWLLKLNK